MISLPLSGLLSRYGFAGGWPSIFYVFGAVGTAWSVAFLIWVYEDPDIHPRIRDSERKFIVGSLGGEKTEQVTRRESPAMAVSCDPYGHFEELMNPLLCADAPNPVDVGAQVDALLGHPGRAHGPELRLRDAAH